MSIRFDEQPKLALEAQRPSKLDPWEVWSHEEARWVDQKSASKAVVEPYLMPTTSEHGRDAAAYLQEILPDCDGWNVLIVYQHPRVEDKVSYREVQLGLARSRAEFKQGKRYPPPDWADVTRRSIWERLMADDSEPPPSV